MTREFNSNARRRFPMQIDRLDVNHAPVYRALMLKAYSCGTGDFTSTVADREGLPLEWWESRLQEGSDAAERVFGAFVDGQLVGAAGIRIGRRLRTCHRATLFGLFVLPRFRGRGIGRALVQSVLESAGSMLEVEVVQLTVTESNAAALRLYESCGFRSWGSEPRAVRVGERCLCKVHMWLEIDRHAAVPDSGS